MVLDMFMRWLLIASNLSRTLSRGRMESREARATIVSSTSPRSVRASPFDARRVARVGSSPSGPGIAPLAPQALETGDFGIVEPIL